MDWISVKERKPELGQKVLLCREYGKHFRPGSEFHDFGEWDGQHWRVKVYACITNDVTHWMPLPHLPHELEV